MREQDDLDHLIDQALGTYADSHPGLERRVLARIAGERRPERRINRLIGLAALAAAACLLLVFVVEHRGSARAPFADAHNAPALPQTQVRSDAPILPQTSQRRHETARHRHVENAVGQSAAARLPKQEIFPMPRPLSPEERALAQFAAQAPETERNSFVEAQGQVDEPIQLARIRIDNLSIPPLESPQAGTN